MPRKLQLPNDLPRCVLATLKSQCSNSSSRDQRLASLGRYSGLGEPGVLQKGRVEAMLQWMPLREEYTTLIRSLQRGKCGKRLPDFNRVLLILCPELEVTEATMTVSTLKGVFERFVAQEFAQAAGIDGITVLDEAVEKGPASGDEDIDDAYARAVMRCLRRIRRPSDYRHMVFLVRETDVFSQIWVFFCVLTFMQFEEQVGEGRLRPLADIAKAALDRLGKKAA